MFPLRKIQHRVCELRFCIKPNELADNPKRRKAEKEIRAFITNRLARGMEAVQSVWEQLGQASPKASPFASPQASPQCIPNSCEEWQEMPETLEKQGLYGNKKTCLQFLANRLDRGTGIRTPTK